MVSSCRIFKADNCPNLTIGKAPLLYFSGHKQFRGWLSFWGLKLRDTKDPLHFSRTLLDKRTASFRKVAAKVEYEVIELVLVVSTQSRNKISSQRNNCVVA